MIEISTVFCASSVLKNDQFRTASSPRLDPKYSTYTIVRECTNVAHIGSKMIGWLKMIWPIMHCQVEHNIMICPQVKL